MNFKRKVSKYTVRANKNQVLAEDGNFKGMWINRKTATDIGCGFFDPRKWLDKNKNSENKL